MNIVLMGPQDSRKGTQAARLAARFSIPHISAGDILREEIAKKTPVGLKVKKAFDEGKLVSKKTTNQIVRKRLENKDAGNGWVLDGYPRSLEQAEFLDTIATVDFVFVIAVPDKVSIARISQRRICTGCGKVYGIALHPKNAGVCDVCGKQLIQREDDTPAAIKTRLEIYHDETEPLIDYYNPRNIVHMIDGNKTV